MSRIGIFFGTDTGRTRLIAKQIAKKLGDLGLPVDAPVNVGRTETSAFMGYTALILGTPTLGDGELPGLDTGLAQPSWAEFLPQLTGQSFAGKTIALFGLGDQEKYPDNFVDGIGLLYDFFLAGGATLIGEWPCAGYTYTSSVAQSGDCFVGLALDQIRQPALTEARLNTWLAGIAPHLQAVCATA